MTTTDADISRQRIDYHVGPDGEQVAILSLTLQDGSEHRFSASVNQEEIDELAATYAAEEQKQMRIEGHHTEEEIAGWLSFVGDAVKAVGNIAKKVVTSKVFKAAAKGVALVAPVLGPLAPAALALSGGMAVASKLGNAAIAAEAGAKRVAKTLARGAVKEARKRAKTAKGRKALLAMGNRKRKSGFLLASRIPGVSLRRRPRGTARRITRRKRPPSVFAAAKSGRLKSLKMGNVTGKQLKRAMKSGRVFWIAAPRRRAA